MNMSIIFQLNVFPLSLFHTFLYWNILTWRKSILDWPSCKVCSDLPWHNNLQSKVKCLIMNISYILPRLNYL